MCAKDAAAHISAFMGLDGQADGNWHRTLFDNAHEAMAVVGLDGGVLYANWRWVALVNGSFTQVMARHLQEVTATPAATADGRADERRLPPLPITRHDGRRVYVELAATRLTVGDETVDLCSARDVSDLVAARHAHAATERRYRALIEQLADVVWSSSLDGQLTFVSGNAEQVCGFSAAELLASPRSFWLDRTHPDDVEALCKAHPSTAPGGTEVEYRWLAKDGQWRWLRTRASLAVDDSGAVAVHGTFADVSERKRL